MFKRNKARRPIAMISTAAAATAVVFAGGLIGAPSAQAAMSSGGSRLTGWAGTNPGVSLYLCDFQGAEGSIGLDVKISNPNGLNIDPCAQLLLVNANGSISSGLSRVDDIVEWERQSAFCAGTMRLVQGLCQPSGKARSTCTLPGCAPPLVLSADERE